MPEIIPNWHPLFVHFTVALYSTSVGFYVLAYLTSCLKPTRPNLSQEFETVARWCLWSVALITVITLLAGLYAYNTVRHDEISHIAMTNHRNWALPTAAAIVLVACYSLWRYRTRKALSALFIIILLIVQGLLLSTAWRGAELVFRYGLGVLSLPQLEGEGHHHLVNSKISSQAANLPLASTAKPITHNHEHH